MGLEKLKSVFKEGWGFPGPVDGWPNTHARGFTLNSKEGSKTQFKIPSVYPILDDIQRGSSYQFVTEDLSTKLYDNENFDPRPGRPRGPIYNINAYEGTRFDDGVGGLFNQSERYYASFGVINTPKFTDIINSGNVTSNAGGYPNLTGLLERYENINPQNESRPKPEGYLKDGKININRTWTQSSIPKFNDLYSVDGGTEKRTIKVNLSDLNASTLFDTGGWKSLYNPDHTVKEDVGYPYPNVSRDNLNIRYQNSGQIGTEPFIVSNILDRLGGSRYSSTEIVKNDVSRIEQYLASTDGLSFIDNQKELVLNSNVESRISVLDVSGKISTTQKYAGTYDKSSTLAAIGSRSNSSTPNTLYRRDHSTIRSKLKYPATIEIGGVDISLGFKIEDTFRGGGVIGGSIGGIGAKIRNPIEPSGDKMTLASMITGTGISAVGGITSNGNLLDIAKVAIGKTLDIESKRNGMPFYFKDLRDETYILFRAYVESITENISPSWSSTNYIGRSEPVYVYERSERDVSFTLKLFAHTPNELDSIYEKIDRLTSMCYPSYVKDENLNGKSRMKPPLLKFRLGELFGSRNNEMLGFLKSCAYSYPDSSPWETEVGKRVPKHITVSLTYQVIHMEVPSLDFVLEDSKNSFYGINQNALDLGDRLKATAMDTAANVLTSAAKGLTGR